jgi:hypothetical protein
MFYIILKNRTLRIFIAFFTSELRKQISLYVFDIQHVTKFNVWILIKVEISLHRNNKLAKLFQPTFQMHRKRLFNI